MVLDAPNTFHRVTPVEGDRVSIIYHTLQHLYRLHEDDWDILRHSGFPVDQLWEGGLVGKPDESEEIDECPQEQVMTVRQTSPSMSEGEIYVETMVDLDANAVFRPTLQAVLWLSELIATTAMRKKMTKKGPKYEEVVTSRVMDDIVAQAQIILDQERSDLVSVMIVMTRILILVVSLVVKLGAQYHLGLVLIQFLAKNIWDPQEIGETDAEVVSDHITTADKHEPALLLCHKLATLMPRSIPYLSITVVILSTGEDLAPHRDIQNHRHFSAKKIASKDAYGIATNLQRDWMSSIVIA